MSQGSLPWCGTELRLEPLICGLLWWRPWLPFVGQVRLIFSVDSPENYVYLLFNWWLFHSYSFETAHTFTLDDLMLTVIPCFVMQVLTSSSPITHRSCWAGWRSENTANTKLNGLPWKSGMRMLYYVCNFGRKCRFCVFGISQTFTSLIWLWKVLGLTHC